jgi:hypothetical protein
MLAPRVLATLTTADMQANSVALVIRSMTPSMGRSTDGALAINRVGGSRREVQAGQLVVHAKARRHEALFY